MEDLKSKTGKEFTKEYGYKFKLGPNGEYIFSNIIEGSGINQSIRFDFEAQSGWTGCIHAHFPGCGNVFSFGDLPFIAGASGFTPNIMSFMYGLATENGYYFLTITDRIAYSQWYSKLFPGGNPDMDEINMWERKFNNDYGINKNSAFGDDEKALLKYLLENNIGLGVMKYNFLQNRFNRIVFDETIGNYYEDECPQ